LVENRYKLIANIKHKRYGGIIPAVTANDNVIFEIELYDDVLPYDLTGVTRCTLVTMKKNKSSVIREGTLSNGLIKFTLSGSETTESGRVEGTVQLYDATNKRVSSAPLAYEVIRDPSLQGGLPTDDKTLVIANESLLTDSIEKSEQAMARVDELITKAPQPSEVVDARGGEVTLGSRLNKLSTSLAEIAYNLDSFPRLAPETTDKGRVDRAIAQLPQGSTLLIPNGEFTVSGNLVVNRKINIKGQDKPVYDSVNDVMLSGTILKDCKILPQTSGVIIENLGLFSTSTDNGFEGSQGYCSNITIRNCVTRVRSHGYLFESYNGLNTDILIQDCLSYKSTHGFISKAMNVTFDNCRAYDHTGGYGFGSISDNIQGATKKGIANNNKHISCYAENCDRGFSFYCRDVFSLDNANAMEMKYLKMLNCTAKNCIYPLMLGDIVTSTTESRLTVSDAIIDNFTEIGTTSAYSIRLGYSINCTINNPVLSKLVDYSDKASRIVINESNSERKNPKNYNIQILEQNTNFPNIDCVSNKLTFKTNNTNTVTVKGLMKGLKGVEVTVIINDVNTSILSGQGNIIMSRSILKGVGSYVTLKWDGTNWQEIYLYDNNVNAPQVTLTSAASGDIDPVNGIIWDIVGTGTTANVINVINTFKPQLTIILRSIGGTFTFGGFGAKFLTNNVPTSMSFGTVTTCNFVYLPAVSKYALVGYSTSNL
jgi:hypothetical protein